MKKLKIVTIGGDSSYTQELMGSFIKHYKELPLTEIWLVDIEEGREKLEDDMLKNELKEFEKGETRAENVKRIEAESFESYKNHNLDHKSEQLTQRGGAYYSDAACEIINSIYNNKQTQMVVSTENNGAISDLLYDSIAEVSAVITSNGPVPLNYGYFNIYFSCFITFRDFLCCYVYFLYGINVDFIKFINFFIFPFPLCNKKIG